MKQRIWVRKKGEDLNPESGVDLSQEEAGDLNPEKRSRI